MQCPSCGEPAPDDAKWCEACGQALNSEPLPACVACGEREVADEGYCLSCGHKQPEERDHMTFEDGAAVAVTDRGRRHRHNEDAVAIGSIPGGATVLVVCDGVSSTPGSAEASLRAAGAARDLLISGLGGDLAGLPSEVGPAPAPPEMPDGPTVLGSAAAGDGVTDPRGATGDGAVANDATGGEMPDHSAPDPSAHDNGLSEGGPPGTGVSGTETLQSDFVGSTIGAAAGSAGGAGTAASSSGGGDEATDSGPVVVDKAALLGRAVEAAQTEASDSVAVASSAPYADGGPPSSTFVAVIVEPTDEGAEVATAWVGDSRAYWVGDEPRRLSGDDHEIAGSLVRWLGADSIDPTPDIDLSTVTGPGHVVVCSDGLWRYAGEPGELNDLVRRLTTDGAEGLDLASAMVAFANEGGGHDNISVALWSSGLRSDRPTDQRPGRAGTDSIDPRPDDGPIGSEAHEENQR